MKNIVDEIHENIPDFDKVKKRKISDFSICYKCPYHEKGECTLVGESIFSSEKYCDICI